MIVKKGSSSVTNKKASDYKEFASKDNNEESNGIYKNDKLVNVIYHDGNYHIYEPAN